MLYDFQHRNVLLTSGYNHDATAFKNTSETLNSSAARSVFGTQSGTIFIFEPNELFAMVTLIL